MLSEIMLGLINPLRPKNKPKQSANIQVING